MNTLSSLFTSFCAGAPRSIQRCIMLFAALALATPMHANSPSASLQDGDILVGAGHFGADAGFIARVRDGNAVTYCEPGSLNFFAPDEVMVDSQGRVVFIAALGPVASYGFGLFRCSAMGATPEVLGVFAGSGANTNQPNPFPGLAFAAVTALHLAPRHVLAIDDNAKNGTLQIGIDDAYVMAVATVNPMGAADWRSVRYHPGDGSWDAGPDPASNKTLNPVGMIYHAGATFSVSDGTLRKESAPLQVTASGKAGNLDFRITLSLFGGRKEIANLITDDGSPSVASGCNSHDGITDAMPLASGSFIPMSGFQQIVFDESGGLGLVIASTYGGLAPYLSQVSDALINSDPSDDKAQMFHDNYVGCAAVPSLHYHRLVSAFSTNALLFPWQGNGVDGGLVSSSRGVMGTQRGYPYGRVIRLQQGDAVETVNTSLFNPKGIGAYPSQVSAGIGTSIIIRINSPVDVLISDASGRSLGVDPNTGSPVNDFGEEGFDSGPGEPRFYGIKNPTPGGYALYIAGTGAGPFTINVYSADLTQSSGKTVESSGVASIGSINHQFFTLGTDQTIAFTARPGAPTFTSVQRAPDGSLRAPLTCVPHLSVTIQASSDLTSWTIITSALPETSPYLFTDPMDVARSVRFYRAFYP